MEDEALEVELQWTSELGDEGFIGRGWANYQEVLQGLLKENFTTSIKLVSTCSEHFYL